jgi:hypothetical protein
MINKHIPPTLLEEGIQEILKPLHGKEAKKPRAKQNALQTRNPKAPNWGLGGRTRRGLML